MRVTDVMTPSPTCCVATTPVQDAARMMLQQHCGSIPVLNSLDFRMPVGIVTDRDITCRVVATGLDPNAVTVGQIMSSPVAAILDDSTIDDCVANMIDSDVRRLIVVNRSGACVGIVAQADLAKTASYGQVAILARRISNLDPLPSRLNDTV